MAGKHGPPGGALMNFRTYPRIPFWEQVHDDEPFHTDTGRMHAYSDVPEAIEYGENFIVHREGPEATPYLPNVIVSSNPYVRPDDYGIPPECRALGRSDGPQRQDAVETRSKQTKNFLWEKGFQFYCLTPKTRHRVHSGWSNVDWHMLYDSNFGDPYRLDKRAPCVGEHQLHINPQARATWTSTTATTSTSTPTRPTGRTSAPSPTTPFYRVALHAAGQVQPRLSLQHRDDEARAVHRHREERQGARDASRRAGAVGEHRLPGQPALRLAAVDHAQLAHADASDRHVCFTRRRST